MNYKQGDFIPHRCLIEIQCLPLTCCFAMLTSPEWPTVPLHAQQSSHALTQPRDPHHPSCSFTGGSSAQPFSGHILAMEAMTSLLANQGAQSWLEKETKDGETLFFFQCFDNFSASFWGSREAPPSPDKQYRLLPGDAAPVLPLQGSTCCCLASHRKSRSRQHNKPHSSRPRTLHRTNPGKHPKPLILLSGQSCLLGPQNGLLPGGNK